MGHAQARVPLSPRMFPMIRSWWACLPGRFGKWKEKIKRNSSRGILTLWRIRWFMSLSQQEKQSLVDLANTARQHAHVPYSHYRVGAALRTKAGHIFTGVNVEN